MLTLTLALAAQLTFANANANANANADDDYSKEVVKPTPLGHQLTMLEGAGGNMTALVGTEGTLLVDDDFAPMADKIIAQLKALGGSSPRFIVNTHFHYDHTGGNEIFGKTATIIAADEVRQRLSTEQILWKKQHPAEPAQALPTLTYHNELTLHLDGQEAHIVHLPNGHTDGDSVVFFDGVASLGDLYFAGMFPIFHSEHNGSLGGYIKNLNTVIARLKDSDKIVPGHGPLSSKTDLVKYRDMIVASRDLVKRAIRTHKTLADVQRTGLDKKWDEFSHGYLTTDKWLALVYTAEK
jgi:cyclase